jgi:hypothetical protein
MAKNINVRPSTWSDQATQSKMQFVVISSCHRSHVPESHHYDVAFPTGAQWSSEGFHTGISGIHRPAEEWGFGGVGGGQFWEKLEHTDTYYVKQIQRTGKQAEMAESEPRPPFRLNSDTSNPRGNIQSEMLNTYRNSLLKSPGPGCVQRVPEWVR